MGCCLSTGDRRSEKERRGGAPPTSPPPVLEEETVKEVLLETPVVSKVDDNRIKGMPMGNQEWKVEVGSTVPINGDAIPDRKADEEIVSEVSEMCSYSESFSNTTAQEKKDDDEDGVVNQRRPMRKRRGGGRGRGERVVARRTAAPSPERRVQVSPLRPVRGMPAAGQLGNVDEENGRRREAAEGSGRRPESPVRCGEVGAPRNASDEKSKVAREPPNDAVAAEEVESLENPVVSLECFIFL